MLYVICYMLYVICYMLYVICFMLYVIWCMLCVITPSIYATICIKPPLCGYLNETPISHHYDYLPVQANWPCACSPDSAHVLRQDHRLLVPLSP
ncbi:hypothetical protein B484DRAFT_135247 [Ochromonadaceae sp. CCMP2298]|nr:hypothetical protein B484DRAFT_135247 [Ochromonadaceae sp. CCMP2298]